MTPEQAKLIVKARASLAAARLLADQSYFGFAASRAYYAMFYVAEALLLAKGLSFSKHSAVISAFGTHFAKTGCVPPEFHHYLIKGQDTRNVGDYGTGPEQTDEEIAPTLHHAQEFLDLATRLLGPLPGKSDCLK